MKKYLVLLFGIVSLFGVHTVKADTITYVYDTSVNNNSFYDKRVQKLLKEGKDFATMWLEFDKDKFKDDNNFVEILEYIENNSIK